MYAMKELKYSHIIKFRSLYFMFDLLKEEFFSS